MSWKTSADQKFAARFCGATSARVLGAPSAAALPTAAQATPAVVPAEPISKQQVKAYSFVDADDFQVIDF